MNHVGLRNDGLSEVPAEVLRSTEIHLVPSEEGGKLSLEARHSEEANSGPVFEFDKHFNVAFRSKILAQYTEPNRANRRILCRAQKSATRSVGNGIAGVI